MGEKVNIQERLDYVFINSDWQLKFSQAYVLHLTTHNSDHPLLLLHTNLAMTTTSQPFRLESTWTWDPDATDVIIKAWSKPTRGDPINSLISKLQCTKVALEFLNKHSFANIQLNIRNLTEYIKHLQNMPQSQSIVDMETSAQLKLHEMLKMEELHWRGKARTTWINERDANTRYLHITTLIHRRHNAIEYTKNSTVSWINDRKDIGHSFLDYFSNLFNSSNPIFLAELQSLFCLSASSSKNARILLVLEEEEICTTLSNMGTHKRPGLDGFNPLFFKTYWHTMGVKVSQAMQHFFYAWRISIDLNHTFIALIPKIEGVTKVEQFRLMALCNMVFKLITKILAN